VTPTEGFSETLDSREWVVRGWLGGDWVDICRGDGMPMADGQKQGGGERGLGAAPKRRHDNRKRFNDQ